MALAAVAVVSAAASWKDPVPRWETAGDPSVLSSPSPAERIGTGRFDVLHDGGRVPVDGHAFDPSTARGVVYFENVSGGRSTIRSFPPLATEVGAELSPREPAVSTDGSRLAFVSGGALWLKDGNAVRSLIKAANIRDPAFGPSGSEIVYARANSVWSIDLTGTRNRQWLAELGEVYDPAVSPDGRWLAYAVQEARSKQIYLRDLSSVEKRKLTAGACNNESPAWSADSRRIVFASDCDRGMGLPALYWMEVAEED